MTGASKKIRRSRLSTDGASVKISANVLHHAVELTVSAVVEEGGSLALSGARLAALAGGFPSKAEITIQADGPTARVACGRPHFRVARMAAGKVTPRAA